MIHFGCEHCGESVRVGDSHAGKSGRCPFCRGVVRIPEQSTRRQEGSDQPPRREGHPDVPPPPSVAVGNELEEEMNLVQIAKDPASETDIIPAENDTGREKQDELDVGNHAPQEQAPSPADQRIPKPVPGVKARSKGKTARRPLRMLLWAWVVLAVVAVLCLLGYVIANQ
jgi:hypothetical protein